MQKIRGVILDVDGTLVDSNDAHARAWVEALADNGHHVSFAQIRRLIGKGGDKILPEVTGLDAKSPQGERISQRRAEIFRTRYLPTLQAQPAAHDLLVHMRQQGLTLVAASSAKKDELHGLLKVCAVDDVISDQVSSDDVERSKPDPDVVYAALYDLKLSSAEVVMLGDTPYDIQSAQKAGIPVIAFRQGGWTDADLEGAAAIYDDPADLLAHYDSSPLSRTVEWTDSDDADCPTPALHSC